LALVSRVRKGGTKWQKTEIGAKIKAARKKRRKKKRNERGFASLKIESVLNKLILTFLLAMLPLTELRGSIPVAVVSFHLPLSYAFIASVLGNLVPIIPILCLIEHFSNWINRHFPIGRAILEWIFHRTRRRARIVEKYGWIGMMLFVAVPIPGSGIWTGSIAAFLLGMSRRTAFVAMTFGVLIAGVLIMLGIKGITKLI